MKLASFRNMRLPNFSVHALRVVLDEAGLDWQTALANADLDAEAVDRPGGTIPAHKELAFQLEFAALTKGRADLWIQASRAYTPGSFAVRGLAFITAPTVEAWVNVASDGMDYGPALLEITPLRTTDNVMTGVEFTHPGAPEDLIPFSVYRDLCSVARNLSWQLGVPFPFTRITLPLAEASYELSNYVTCPIECGAETLQLWWAPETSALELPLGDAFQHAAWVRADNQILDSLRADGDWPNAVRQAIRAAPDRNRNLAHVAASLQVSSRTLQRKLELTGHEFTQLREKTLCELASDLLSNTSYSVSRISRTLGYAEPASFTVAFKRWTGVPPTAFREGSNYHGAAGSVL